MDLASSPENSPVRRKTPTPRHNPNAMMDSLPEVDEPQSKVFYWAGPNSVCTTSMLMSLKPASVKIFQLKLAMKITFGVKVTLEAPVSEKTFKNLLMTTPRNLDNCLTNGDKKVTFVNQPSMYKFTGQESHLQHLLTEIEKDDNKKNCWVYEETPFTPEKERYNKLAYGIQETFVSWEKDERIFTRAQFRMHGAREGYLVMVQHPMMPGVFVPCVSRFCVENTSKLMQSHLFTMRASIAHIEWFSDPNEKMEWFLENFARGEKFFRMPEPEMHIRFLDARGDDQNYFMHQRRNYFGFVYTYTMGGVQVKYDMGVVRPSFLDSQKPVNIWERIAQEDLLPGIVITDVAEGMDAAKLHYCVLCTAQSHTVEQVQDAWTQFKRGTPDCKIEINGLVIGDDTGRFVMEGYTGFREMRESCIGKQIKKSMFEGKFEAWHRPEVEGEFRAYTMHWNSLPPLPINNAESVIKRLQNNAVELARHLANEKSTVLRLKAEASRMTTESLASGNQRLLEENERLKLDVSRQRALNLVSSIPPRVLVENEQYKREIENLKLQIHDLEGETRSLKRKVDGLETEKRITMEAMDLLRNSASEWVRNVQNRADGLLSELFEVPGPLRSPVSS